MSILKIDSFYRDLILIAVGIALMSVLTHLGVVRHLLEQFEANAILGSFITGIFFTSVFTLGPAVVVLAELAHIAPPLTVALWGGLGAMCGDALLFLFIRDVFAEDLRQFLKKHKLHLFTIPHFGFLRWLYPAIGAFIIASPLPDELGLTLLGLTKSKLSILLPLVFVMNFIGIFTIGVLANVF